MHTRRRILSFRNDWNGLGPKGSDLVGGVGYYRIQKPLSFLKDTYDVFDLGDLHVAVAKMKKIGKDWTIDELVPNLIKDADLTFMKNISHPGGLAWFAGASEFYNKPVILDMDDDYLHVDDLNPNRKYFHETELADISHKILFKSVTAITVSTEPLKKVYEQFNKNVHVLHNYNDINDWKYKKERRNDGKIVIGWAGSQTHEADFNILVPVIEELWKLYKGLITFSICGGLPPELIEKLPKGSAVAYSGTRTMRDYPARLASWGFDIGLAPLKESEFNDGKGHGKWMEYAMYKIPLVATDFGPYKRVCTDKKDALLVKSTDEWIDAISYLIENKEARKKIGMAAYQTVKKQWQWKDNAHKWGEVFEQYQTFR